MYLQTPFQSQQMVATDGKQMETQFGWPPQATVANRFNADAGGIAHICLKQQAGLWFWLGC